MGIEESRDARQDAHPEVPFVDLKGSARQLGPAFLRELESLMEEGSFVNGPYVEAFERDFAAACGRSHCVGVASGLDALRLGLIALGLKPGDEVIVPAMTFIATFEAVVQAGGTPLVVDVRDDDVCLDMDAAIAAVGPRTRFVMPVHLYGQIVDLAGLDELASHYGLAVHEDACQAHGAVRDGRVAGRCGDSAAFSFYPSKNLGAMGDGGAFVTDDEKVANTVRSLREHGQTTRYRSDFVGYTSRLDAIQALVLSHKLPLLEAGNRSRRAAAERYSDALAGVGDLQLPVVAERSVPVWHLYTIRTADPVALAGHLARRGIRTGHHYPQPPHLSPAFSALGHERGAFPVAEAVASETLSLPIYPGIDEVRQEAVVTAIRAFFAHG